MGTFVQPQQIIFDCVIINKFSDVDFCLAQSFFEKIDSFSYLTKKCQFYKKINFYYISPILVRLVTIMSR